MATQTYLALYDDFQQAQRVAGYLRNENIQMQDVTIVSRRDTETAFKRFHKHFGDMESPAYLHERESRKAKIVRPLLIGAVIGAVPMGLTTFVSDMAFGGVWATFGAMLFFGALVGAGLAAIVSMMDVFTQVRTNHKEVYDEAMVENMAILAVHNDGKYEEASILRIMRENTPVEVTQAEGEAFPGTGWLADEDLDKPDDDESHDTIVDQRHRAYKWAEGEQRTS